LCAATVEAMGLGIPVVATACGAMRILIETGVNGFVIAQTSEETIIAECATAIGRLATADALRRKLGGASRQRAQKFAPEVTASETLALYERLVSSRSSRRFPVFKADHTLREGGRRL
jgi:glycosyltransferase involved in cell wall biosynthesis